MKRFYKRFAEKFIEGLLMLSGTITSLVVVLIVIFLFKEGTGVFSQSPVEEGFVVAINKSNKIEKLTAAQLNLINDGAIVNWKELGGNNDSILIVRESDLETYLGNMPCEDFKECINTLVDSLPGILIYLPKKLLAKKFSGKDITPKNISVSEFIGGKNWLPTATPAAEFGVLPLIMGTLWVSLFAILIALPLGLAAAIFMSEIASDKLRRVLKPLIELLAGIPSIVYGFFGLVIVVPTIQKMFDLPVGETALAGSIILAIMALPTIITISEDAMRNTPRAMKEASLALGASKWQTIYKVVIPYSISGISAAAILGVGRAVGETMAVLMVTGNSSVMPSSLLEPVRTIPATIAAELGEAPEGTPHYKALFTLGCILFVLTLLINLSVEFISNRKKYKKH